MIYNKRSANGNAGEYYFAYWVSRYFKWPCRLLDIDVGIDAQIEIFDDENHSTGDFIGVQIKTAKSSKLSVPIKLKNLEYWKSIDDVVILALVTINTVKPKVYWKEINDKNIDSYITKAMSNKSKTTSVTFDDSNLLTQCQKEKIGTLPYSGSLKSLQKNLKEILRVSNKINDKFWCERELNYSRRNLGGIDITSANYFMSRFAYVCDIMDEVDAVIKSKPKITKFLSNLEEARKSYRQFNSNVSDVADYMSTVDSDHEYEFYNSWVSPDNNIKVINIMRSQYMR